MRTARSLVYNIAPDFACCVLGHAFVACALGTLCRDDLLFAATRTDSRVRSHAGDRYLLRNHKVRSSEIYVKWFGVSTAATGFLFAVMFNCFNDPDEFDRCPKLSQCTSDE